MPPKHLTSYVNAPLITYTNEKFSILPAVSKAYPLIKFEEKFQATLLLEPQFVLET